MLQNIKTAFDIIQGYLHGNLIEYAQLRLTAAKNIFSGVAFLYFLSLLMTLGGFYPEIISLGVFYIFPGFVFSFLLLVYCLLDYYYIINAKNPIGLRVTLLSILASIFTVILIVHFGWINLSYIKTHW